MFPTEVSLSLILDDNSQPHGIMGLSRDITERQFLEEELRQHVRALEEADRRRNDFLAMLAHELRNPLAPIRSAVDILRRPGAGSDLGGAAREVISRQVEHMVRLVDDLLDVSRITRGKIAIRRDRIPLDAVVHSGIEISRTLIDACGHELNVSLPDMSLCVLGDGVRLAQVVANLLNNAAKYTPERGRIWLQLEQDDDYAVIHVRDTGIGIPSDLLPRVFDLFVQADRSLDRARGGLGLGLTLVRQLVELHGGTVLAHSGGAGKGSEFAVRLPLDRCGQPAEAPLTSGRPGQRTDSPQRILIVDDHADSAAMLAELLRMHGQEVRTAGNGAMAIQVAKSFRPGVVLLDIGLPGMDGFEIARRLRNLFSEEELRLVALSGFGHPEALRQSRDAGFQDHIVKPVDLLRAPRSRSLSPSLRRPREAGGGVRLIRTVGGIKVLAATTNRVVSSDANHRTNQIDRCFERLSRQHRPDSGRSRDRPGR